MRLFSKADFVDFGNNGNCVISNVGQGLEHVQ